MSLSDELVEVDEDSGNVTLCAVLIDGVLERGITVYLSTDDISAIGKQ